MENNKKKKQTFGMLVGLYVILAFSFGIITFLELNKIAKDGLFTEMFADAAGMLVFFSGVIIYITALVVFFGKRLLSYLEETALEEGAEGEVTSNPTQNRPATICYLLYRENAKGKDITATLVDLVKRGYLLLEQGKSIMDVLDKETNVVIFKNGEANFNALSPYEAMLVRWFVDEMGDGKCFRTSVVRRNLLENPLVAQKIARFQEEVKKEVEEMQLFKEQKKNNLSFILVAILILLSFKYSGNLNVLFIIFSLVQALFVKIVFADTKQNYLTDKGSKLLEEYMKYKKYLDNLNPNEVNYEELVFKIVMQSKINEDCLFKTVDKFRA